MLPVSTGVGHIVRAKCPESSMYRERAETLEGTYGESTRDGNGNIFAAAVLSSAMRGRE